MSTPHDPLDLVLDNLNRDADTCFSVGDKPAAPIFFRSPVSGEITVALPHRLGDLLHRFAQEREMGAWVESVIANPNQTQLDF